MRNLIRKSRRNFTAVSEHKAPFASMPRIFNFKRCFQFLAMYASVLLLLTAASALCRISMATATTLVKEEDNGRNNNNNNNNYNALITSTQQLAQQFKQLQLEQEQQQQQQQLQQQQHLNQQHFEPFDFANLRQLHLKYKNGQQQISQHNNNNNEQRDHDNNYYGYSISSNNNKPNGNGNPHRDNDIAALDDHVVIRTIADAAAAAASGAATTGDVDDDYEHQDARNGFRLQLSASNEPSSSTKVSGGGAGGSSSGVGGGDNSNNISDNKKNNNGYSAAKSNKQNSNNAKNDISFGDMEFYDEVEANQPYGIQNVKRSKRKNLEHSGKVTTYQSLCPTKRNSIPLETTSYEYRPNHYIEVTCAHNYGPSHVLEDYNKNRICSEAGFACIQLNRTIHLIRRNKASVIDCWESEIRIVPSGCECMWPKHHYGDIITYHQESKRQNSRSINLPDARDGSIVGVGELGHVEDADYLQIPIEMVVDEQGHERPKERIYDIYEY